MMDSALRYALRHAFRLMADRLPLRYAVAVALYYAFYEFFPLLRCRQSLPIFRRISRDAFAFDADS